LHRLTRGHEEFYFTIQSNVFDPKAKLVEVYDLKGSSVGRQVMVPNKPILRRQASVLKDLDFTRTVWLENATRQRILNQLQTDTAFLEQHNLMDYSLLLGIANQPEPGTPVSSPSVARRSVTVSADLSSLRKEVVVSPNLATSPLSQEQRTAQSSEKQTPEKSDATVTVTVPSDSPSKPYNSHKRRSFLCFVEETYDPHLQNVPKRLSGAASPRPSTPRSILKSSKSADPVTPRSDEGAAPKSPRVQVQHTTIVKSATTVSSLSQEAFSGQHVAISDSKALSFWINLPSCDPALCSDELYYVGLIDFLTVYDTSKRLSGFFQSVRHGRESVSTVSPEFYARRFMQMATADLSSVQGDLSDRGSTDGQGEEDARRGDAEEPADVDDEPADVGEEPADVDEEPADVDDEPADVDDGDDDSNSSGSSKSDSGSSDSGDE